MINSDYLTNANRLTVGIRDEELLVTKNLQTERVDANLGVVQSSSRSPKITVGSKVLLFHIIALQQIEKWLVFEI